MIDREIKKSIYEINNTFRVLVVTGPRQVGKSTILKSQMPSNMKYISLDDETLKEEAKTNPKLFLEMMGKPLFIDEIQYAPGLFPYIKMEVDNDKTRGQYWLSGSQTFELMSGVSESLAGRVGIVKMNSLTYREVKNNINDYIFDPVNIKEGKNISVDEIFKHIYKGGMPELYDIENMSREKFFESYIDTYLEKDVRKIINVNNLELFKKFIRSLALRNGKTLNYSDIANDVGTSSATIKEWVSVLVTSRIIYLLEPYHNNKIERLTHLPKIIFMDSGLACYLSDFTDYRELMLSAESGSYFETFVISEIIKSYEANCKPLNITYLRNKEKEEINLIISKNATIYPIEIKKTANPKREMLRNFNILEKNGVKVGNGGIVCLYDRLMPLDEKNYIIPIASVINPDF